MTWNPFKDDKQANADPQNASPDGVEKNADGTPKTPEKTPAELIADSVREALKPVVESVSALSGKVDALEAGSRRPANQNADGNEGAPQRVSVFDDEAGAFAQNLGPVLKMQFEMEARIVRDQVKAEYVEAGYGEAWKQFAQEINDTLDRSPLIDGNGNKMRGNPEYIKNTVNMVFGRAAVKAGLKFGGKDKGFFIESAGGSDGSTGSSTPTDGLSDDQRRAFVRFGIDPKEGAKTLGKMKTNAKYFGN